MMKKVFKGWVGRRARAEEIFLWCRTPAIKRWLVTSALVFQKKGKNDGFWASESWPPKKVTITVEVEDA